MNQYRYCWKGELPHQNKAVFDFSLDSLESMLDTGNSHSSTQRQRRYSGFVPGWFGSRSSLQPVVE
jgi:hypothetical protein